MTNNEKYILINLKYYEKHKDDIFADLKPVIIDSPEHHEFKQAMGEINKYTDGQNQ